MSRPRQFDNYKKNISQWENDEQTQTLNVFLVLTCLSARSGSLTLPLEHTPKLGARKLSSPHIFVDGVQLTSLSCHFSSSNPKRPQVVLSLPPGVGGKDSCFHTLPRMRTRILDLQFSLVILNYKSLDLAVRRLTASFYSFLHLSIYLFIYSTSSKQF